LAVEFPVPALQTKIALQLARLLRLPFGALQPKAISLETQRDIGDFYTRQFSAHHNFAFRLAEVYVRDPRAKRKGIQEFLFMEQQITR
jgi:hypothetical protein